MGLFSGFSNFLGRFRTWGSSWFLRWFSSPTSFKDLSDYAAKLNAIKSNPVLCRTFCINMDLFCLGRFYVYEEVEGKDVLVPNDPALNILNNPNAFQSREDFLKEYMFWLMVDTAHVYMDSNVPLNEDNRMYVLHNGKIEWPRELELIADKILLSTQSEKAIFDTPITYRYEDNDTWVFKLGSLMSISDLPTKGNKFVADSRLDSLIKVISNSEMSLDAKNINLHFAGKFAVGGQADPKKAEAILMASEEKEDIERQANSRKAVTAVQSKVEILRFVTDVAALKLDESQAADLRIAGQAYGIPKDVIEADISSTFENQEKARGAHVTYCLQQKGDALGGRVAKRFGYDKLPRKKKIIMSWDHLPFMQFYEETMAKTKESKAKTFKILIDQNVSLPEINDFLDTDFKSGEKNLLAGLPNDNNNGGNSNNSK